MQFYSSYFLNLLWLVPVLVVCFFASGFLNEKRLKSFLRTREIQDKLLPHYNRFEWPLRGSFLLAAFLLIVLALSQPQWGEEKKKVERKGVDLIFLLDVSTSMLAEDIKPSRVQKAKFLIEAFVKSLKGDRIGMLTFAGSSFMQTPLTLDYSAFLIFLSGVDVGHVPDPGTSLGPAIEKAIAAFSDEKGKQKALIVFSDGEDHDAQLDGALDAAEKQNVRIYTVGTATGEGAPIPLRGENGAQTAVKKDRSGNIVITKLNKPLLAKAASETGGIYLPATPSEKEVDLILKHLSSLGEKKLEDRLITEKEDHYQVFLFAALILLMLEMLVRRGRSARVNFLPVLLLGVFFLHSGFLPTSKSTVDEGNKDFEGKRYQSAIEKYREVQVKNPDDPAVGYNLATSLYKVDQYPESAAYLKKSLESAKKEKDAALQAKVSYNLGNALFRMGDYDGAIEAYKKALEFDPQDKDSKYNLEYIQDQKSKFEKENQDRKKDNQQKKNDQNQQKNNKNQQQNKQNQQNQSGGGGSSQKQDQSQGQNQQNQQGQGQQDQKQNQGGQGQNQQNSGQNQGQDQKDQGQGQNQSQNQQSQGGQSEQDKNQQDQKQQSGGQGQQQDQQKQNEPQQQQGQAGGAGQDQKQDQGQGDQQDQKNQQGQGDQKQDQSKQQGQGQQSSGQPGGDKQDQQDKPDSQGQQKEGQEPDQKPGDQQGKQPQGQQGGTSGGQSGGEKGQQQQASAGAAGKPLQGQMTKENAEYLLASLEEGEKKFQVMRKPAENQSENPYVEKDW